MLRLTRDHGQDHGPAHGQGSVAGGNAGCTDCFEEGPGSKEIYVGSLGYPNHHQWIQVQHQQFNYDPTGLWRQQQQLQFEQQQLQYYIPLSPQMLNVAYEEPSCIAYPCQTVADSSQYHTNHSNHLQQHRSHHNMQCMSANPTTKVNRSVNNNKKRSVSFASMNEVYYNSTDLNEIVTTCWYSRDDLRQFKGERKMIVRMLKSVGFDATKIDTSIYDLRGLEAYSSIAFNTLLQRKRKNVFIAVMNEQQRQRSGDCNFVCHSSSRHQHCHQQQQQQLIMMVLDAESIRNVSISASKWARERGLELGRADAMLVGNNPYSNNASFDDISASPYKNMDDDADDDEDDDAMAVEATAAAIPPRMALLTRDSFSTACSSSSSSDGSGYFSIDSVADSSMSSSSSSSSTWAEKLMGEDLIPDEE